MKLGIVTYQIAAEMDVPTIIDLCSKTGIEGVELRTTHAHGVEVELGGDARAAVRKQFEDSSVELAGLGSAFEYQSADPDELRANIDGTKEYCRLAADVGAPGVKVRPNKFAEGVPKEKTIEQIGLSLRECGEFAAGLGVQIRLEVHGKETCHPPYVKQMMDVADHDNVFVCWNSNQADLDETGSIDKHFDMLKDKIALVHVRDICLPEYPWKHLLTRLKDMGYEGYTLAEIPANEDPERILRYLYALWHAYVD